MHNALGFACTRITPSATQEGEYLIFRVSVDGPGFPQTLLKDNLDAPCESQRGSGLGLYFNSVAKTHQNKSRIGKVAFANDGGRGF